MNNKKIEKRIMSYLSDKIAPIEKEIEAIVLRLLNP